MPGPGPSPRLGPGPGLDLEVRLTNQKSAGEAWVWRARTRALPGTLMRESLGKKFYGRVLNPSGVRSICPLVFKRLKTLHLLERDSGNRKNGEFARRVSALMEIWEEPEFRPDQVTSVASGCRPRRPRRKRPFQSFSQSAWRDCSGRVNCGMHCDL